ncbi:MAG TPA: tetratricopeptide repeat protein [Geobacteraceae bacterium]
MENAQRKNVMRGNELSRSSRTAALGGFLLLATGLALSAGCTTLKAKVEPSEPKPAAAAQPAPPVATGPTVTHLANGREGFVIKDPSGMNAQARADFDQASVLIREAKYDKAIELLEKVIAQSPGASAPHINVAIAYRQVDKAEQAEQHLKTALELIPGHPVASNEYGLLLRKAGRFAEGRQVYEQSLAAFPEYYPIHKNLGILCDIYLKDAACAATHYEIYEKAMPKDPQVKLWLADLQTRAGKNLTASAGSVPHP